MNSRQSVSEPYKIAGSFASDPYTHANPFFVEAIRAAWRPGLSVLDVGCWNGALGRALADLQDLVIDGIERDSGQAELARYSGYRTVHCMDLDRDRLDMIGGRYDFVLFGDVLEHLLDSSATLRAARELLAPKGHVLVSVPNVAFAICRLQHLLGRWDYVDYGILDRTHLRFFTRRTLIKMLIECGYELEWCKGYVGLSSYRWLVREPLRWLGKVWPSLFAIQLVAAGRLANEAR